MAGLLIKELLVRGDLHRCLVVCPGMLTEQWQDEFGFKFHLPFEILTNDKLESARTGHWFLENPLAICRLDKLSRDESVQAKLDQTDWDLIVVDEAHKMSASFFSGEVKATKRYRLGQQLSPLTRHFLLMTATPHNGKEEDFQLFMALLDGDRFEGRFRDGVHQVDVSDLMRRHDGVLCLQADRSGRGGRQRRPREHCSRFHWVGNYAHRAAKGRGHSYGNLARTLCPSREKRGPRNQRAGLLHRTQLPAASY
jgi:hypothetical protein